MIDLSASWRTTILGVIPALAGLALVIIGAIKGQTELWVTGLGLLGAGGVGAVARDQAQHAAEQAAPKP